MRPHVIINCAMSADGKIALPSRVQTRISSDEDIERVHKLRASCDGILVGIETVLSDDPKLTVKSKYAEVEKQPYRIVLDSNGRTPSEHHVLDGSAPTIIATTVNTNKNFNNADVLRMGSGCVDLKALLEALKKKGIERLLVEGGETVIWSFLNGGFADELYIYVGSLVIGGRNSPTVAGGEGSRRLEENIPLKLVSAERLGDGVLLKYEVMG